MSRSGSDRLVTHLGVLLVLNVSVLPVVAAAADPPKRVEAVLMILTPMDIASAAAIDEKLPTHNEFIEWVKPVFAAVDSQFATERARRTVVVQLTLHPDRVAEVAVAGRPAPTEAESMAILAVADPARAPRSRITDCVFRVVAKINGGDPDEDRPLSPPLALPLERRLAGFRAASTPERLALLRRWARAEAIPLMGQIAADVDPKFEGVRKLGKALKDVKAEGPIDCAALTDKNPDYWRAMMEMAPGIPLCAAVRVALHAANGEIDAAQRVVRTFGRFDQHQSGYSALLGEFSAMAAVFFPDVVGRIQKGIELNDAGKFDEALDAYNGVLEDYPHSAWAHYERYQTLLTKVLKTNLNDKTLPDWSSVRKSILESDALYGSMANATSDDELYDLLLRKETEELFKDKARTVHDLLRYADIAVDLGQPGVAALIEWNVLLSVKPEDYQHRNLIEDVLYCLERLGAKLIKQNFKGDHAAEFARIDTERASRRRESPASRVMAPKNEPKKDQSP